MIHEFFQVPSDRILLETDAPDALPKSKSDSLYLVEGDPSLPEFLKTKEQSAPTGSQQSTLLCSSTDASTLPRETLNHPANIQNVLH